MSTSKSPLATLQAEADRIANTMKDAEAGKLNYMLIPGARDRPTFKTGIVQDDKVITIEMTWGDIKRHSHTALSAMVLKHMQGVTQN